MIMLGMVNGGLGLLLGGDEHDKTRTIPYIVIASVFGGIWVLVILGNLIKTKGQSENPVGTSLKKTSFDSENGNGYDHEKYGEAARSGQPPHEDVNGTSLHGAPNGGAFRDVDLGTTNGQANGDTDSGVRRSGSGLLSFLHKS